MLPHVSALRLFASILALTALSGCAYDKQEGVSANGANRQLFFTPASGVSDDVAAVGFARTITVARFGPTTVRCHGLNGASAGSVHIQGGGPPPDTCAGHPADSITLVSATCDASACTVTSEAKDGSIVFHVTGTAAGATRLLVSVKDTTDGNPYDDALPLEFAVAARIGVAALPGDLPALKLPVLVGIDMPWPTGRVVDAAGRTLSIEDSPLTHALEGDAYESKASSDRYASIDAGLVARRAGHSTLHWTLPGFLDRKVDLEVVDPAEAHALFVYAPQAETTVAQDGDLDLVDGDPQTSSGRVTALTVEADSYLTTTFPTRVQLNDGRLALALVASIEVVPASLAIALPGDVPGSIRLYNGAAAGTKGTATLRVDGGGPTLTLPLTATPAAADPDSR